MTGNRAMVIVLLLASAGAMADETPLLIPVPKDRIHDARPLGRKYALLIGVPDFQDQGWPKLKFTVRDVETMADVLEGFEVVRLTDRERTTRASILEALQHLKSQAVRADDTVLVYLSTHGTLGRPRPSEVRRYAIAQDTRKDLVEKTAVSIDELLSAMEELPSKRKVLILAFCHSGTGKSALNDDLSRALAGRKSGFFLKPVEEVSRAMVVLSAASWGEAAIEDDALGGDVYTHYFAEGIKKGDLDGDGAVTATEAHEYARERVYNHTMGLQRPSLEMVVEGTDPIVLSGQRTKAGRPILFSYGESSRGVALFLNGRLKGTFPAAFVLDSDSSAAVELKSASGTTLYSGNVHLASGESIEISRLIPPPVKVEVLLDIGVRQFFDGKLSNQVVPASPMIGLEVAVRDLLYRGARFGINARFSWGDGRITTTSHSVPYSSQLTTVGAQYGHALTLKPWLILSGSVSGSVAVLSRDIRVDFSNVYGFRSHQQSLGGLISAPLMLAATPFWNTIIGLWAEPGMSLMRIDGGLRTSLFVASGGFVGAFF